MRSLPAFVIAIAALSGPASAQNFNQAIIFGDSSVDSGAYRGLASPGGGAALNALWASAVAAGAGKPTQQSWSHEFRGVGCNVRSLGAAGDAARHSW
jgi:hypothetical protein